MGWATLAVTAWFGCGSKPAPPPGACALGPADACYADGQARARAFPLDLEGAAERFGQACDDGHARACVDLGLMLQDGRGVPVDAERARKLYERACAAELGVGCLNLAFMYQTGNGVVADDERAATEYRRAFDRFRASCAPPEPHDCANLGFILASGFGVSVPDPREARQVYALGCGLGDDGSAKSRPRDPEACVNLALSWLDDGEPDLARVVEVLSRACDAGAGVGCGALGQLLYTGRPGLAPDPARAVATLDRGCGLGHGQTCGALGAVLSLGQQVAVDAERARATEERGCALGDGTSCVVLAQGALGALNGGDPSAAAPAARWLEAACHIGEGEACDQLAAMVAAGAAPGDPMVWRTAACRLRNPSACVVLLRAGRALPLSSAAQDDFLEQACANGVPEACLTGDGTARPSPPPTPP